MSKSLSILTQLTLNAAGFDKGIDGAKAKTQSLKEGTEKAGSAMKGVFANAGAMFAPITGELSGLSSGIMSGVGSFKAMIPAISSVKGAFIASGIGAIVIGLSLAFAGLVSWMKRTDEGGDSMRKVFDVIKAVINTILDKLAALGSAIVKLIKGDFKGAGEDAKRAFSNWGDAISENVKKAEKLNEVQDKLEDFNETAALKRERITNRISELEKNSRDEETYSAKQRLSFVQQIRGAYGELHKLNNEGFQLELSALKTEQSTNANNQEIRQKINEKEAEGIRLRSEYNNNVTATSKLYKKTKNEIEGEIKALEKFNAEKLKSLKDADMKGNSNTQIKSRLSEIKVTSDVQATLTARQNTYNSSLKKSNSLWKDFGKEIKSNQFLLQTFSGAIDGITGAFTDLFSSGTANFKGFVTSILQGLQKIINGLLAQAIAGMIAGEAKKGIWGLATGAIGLAALTGIWQAKVPKFESGGIVGGNSFFGDKVPALVNSGEMILNSSQQGNLFKMLNGALGGNGGEVRFILEGDKLVGVINNHNRRINKFS